MEKAAENIYKGSETVSIQDGRQSPNLSEPRLDFNEEERERAMLIREPPGSTAG